MKRTFLDRTADEIRAERQRLRVEYRQLYDEVAEILFRADPIGINYESNIDEYEPEVETILPRLKEAASAEELRRIIYEEFMYWFSGIDIGPESKYHGIASETWAAWVRHQKI